MVKYSRGKRPKIFNFDVRRRREIERLALAVGAANTDDLATYLVAWVWHNRACKDEHQPFAVVEVAARIGRKGMTEAGAAEIIAEAKKTRRCLTADNLARFLCLTFAQRQSLGITTIGAVDVNKKQREAIRKRNKRARDRDRQRRKRREAGATPRAEYEAKSHSKRKSWENAGFRCRRTWERHRKQAA
jgi:hypothetical protein